MTDRNVTEVASGKTTFGGTWAVGTDEARLLVLVDGFLLAVDGVERDKFAEAVARTAMPGQVSRKRGNHGPGCGCTPCKAEWPNEAALAAGTEG